MRPGGEVSSSSGRMSYETDGSSEGSPRSHASPPDTGVGSPTQSEASPGPCTSTHPNPGQKARNEAEKHRRDRINRGVNTLCGMVGPAYLTKQQKKIDKITTLRLAANYMRRAFIQCFIASLNAQKKSSLPLDLIEVIQNFTEDSGFWLTINRRGKILDATEGIQHLLGYNLVDVANEDLAKFVDPSQSDILMTEKLLGYPDDCTEMVTKDVTLYMQPKPTGRKDNLRSGAPVHVRGFMGPIQSLVGTAAGTTGELGAEARQRLMPDDEVILVARVTPAGLRVTGHVEPRPENEYILQVRSDGVIVGSDSRISLCAGFLPSEVRKKSAHSFLHQDDQMWAAVRQGLMFLYPQEFDSVTVRLINNMDEIEYVNVRADIVSDQKRMPAGHFTTRNIIISGEEARRERGEEMRHLQRFLRDVLIGKYPREQVQAMVQAIMGPMMGQLNTFLDGPTNFTEAFSSEFNMCMFQMLADFSRSLPPPPDSSAGWPASSSNSDVQITELDSTTPNPPGAAGPAGATGLPGPPAGSPGATCGPDGRLGTAPQAGAAPPSHSTVPMEPLCVDTYSAADIPANDLHTLLSSCSDDQWEDPVAAGPSPAASDYSVATQPSPIGTGGDGGAGGVRGPGGTFCPPTNGMPSAQFGACALQSPPQQFTVPMRPSQPCAMQPSPQRYPAPSPQSYTGNVPQPCGVQSPAQSYAAASPQSYAAASPQSYGTASPQSYAAASPQSYAAASPQSRYASMSPGQCYASPPPNGQMVSPPYGQPVRQSCQFQPSAASQSGYQETGMFLSPPMQQQQQVVPDYSQHSQEMSNRHCMAQQPSAMDTGQLGVSDLGALELAVDSLPLLIAPATSSNPQPPDDALMNWSHG